MLALNADVGFAIRINSPRRLQAALGTFRWNQRRKGIMVYDALTFRCPASATDELWILKKAALEDTQDA